MATFSVNQVNHLYVVKADAIDNTGSTKTALNNLTPVGTIALGKTIDGELYFQHRGAGGVTRTDLIDPAKIMWATRADYKKSATRYKNYTIEIDNTALEDAKTMANYAGTNTPLYLKFVFRGYLAPGDDDIYQQYVDLKDATDLTQCALDIYKAFHKNGVEPAIDVIINDKRVSDISEITGVTKLVVAAAVPDWRRGVKSSKPANFYIEALFGADANLYTDAQDPNKYISFNPEGVSTFINKAVTITRNDDIIEGNGRNIADLEWFFMGERADQYRGVGWPNNIDTQYLVDENTNYDTLQIHYYFSDSGVSVQKSEKDVTIVGEASYIDSLVTLLEAQDVKITKSV